jgi:hypothetical protein
VTVNLTTSTSAASSGLVLSTNLSLGGPTAEFTVGQYAYRLRLVDIAVAGSFPSRAAFFSGERKATE